MTAEVPSLVAVVARRKIRTSTSTKVGITWPSNMKKAAQQGLKVIMQLPLPYTDLNLRHAQVTDLISIH